MIWQHYLAGNMVVIWIKPNPYELARLGIEWIFKSFYNN